LRLRTLIAALAGVAGTLLALERGAGSAQPADVLPPPYPRDGATKVLDNDRVQVWDITWLKQKYPLHRHVYDLVGVYYSPGDRLIVSTAGERRHVSTAAWNTAFQRRGLTHTEEGASDAPLKAVFVEIKDEPRPDASAGRVLSDPASASGAPAFPSATGKQLVDNDRATIWEFVPMPAVPGTAHLHRHDAVVVSFSAGGPEVSFTARGTTHRDEGVTAAERVYVIEIK
jgi:hypothetical protein